MRRVLILDNAIYRWPLRPAALWRAWLGDIDTVTVHVPSGDAIPPIDRFTHVLLAGSSASILEPQPWFDEEAAAIRETVDRRIPLLGSCFGHELLVLALSGPSCVRRSTTPEIGWIRVEMTAPDPLFERFPDPWPTFAYHAEEVVDPPSPWRVLGRTERCAAHILRYGDHPVYGIQGHPEISPCAAGCYLLVAAALGRLSPGHALRAARSAPRQQELAVPLRSRFLALEATP